MEKVNETLIISVALLAFIILAIIFVGMERSMDCELNPEAEGCFCDKYNIYCAVPFNSGTIIWTDYEGREQRIDARYLNGSLMTFTDFCTNTWKGKIEKTCIKAHEPCPKYVEDVGNYFGSKLVERFDDSCGYSVKPLTNPNELLYLTLEQCDEINERSLDTTKFNTCVAVCRWYNQQIQSVSDKYYFAGEKDRMDDFDDYTKLTDDCQQMCLDYCG